MRIIDLQLSLPAILLALVLVALLGQGLMQLVAALVAAQYAYFARTTHGAASAERRKDYIEAALSTPLPARHVLFRHLLPNALPPLIVVATVQVANSIALEATLSFLGLGLPHHPAFAGLADFQRLPVPAVGPLLDLDLSRHRPDADRRRDQSRRRPGPQRSEPEAQPMSEAVLRVKDLQTQFQTRAGVLKAVDGVSFEVARGRILGLVGESGSGKSVTGYSILGLIEPPGRIAGGEVLLNGKDLTRLKGEAIRQVRGAQIAMVFQDPMMTLNPVLKIGTQMIAAVRAHDRVSRKVARGRARDALAKVGIPSPEERLDAYPHQLSGGMRQRVAIAIALLHSPAVIIADEPTTALDVSIQGQILAEVRRLADETGTAFVWVTHDLAVVSSLADDICVMYAGRVVESGPAAEVIASPRHPYTAGLLASVPAEHEPGTKLAAGARIDAFARQSSARAARSHRAASRPDPPARPRRLSSNSKTAAPPSAITQSSPFHASRSP